MKLSKLVLVCVTVGTLGVLGCGDEGGGGDGGNGSASQVCAACDALENECVEAYNFCVAENPPAAQGDCSAFGLAACEVSQ